MTRTARAERLAHFDELTATLSNAIGRCRRTGLAPESYRGLTGALITLLGTSGIAAVAMSAADVVLTFSRWPDDSELLEAIAGIELGLGARLSLICDSFTSAQADLAHAVRIYNASQDPNDRRAAHQVITDCRGALEILESADRQLDYASSRVRAVPEDLGETYAAAYNTLRRGHTLPYEGRWITGEGIHLPLKEGIST